jgi:hypothetical protein
MGFRWRASFSQYQVRANMPGAALKFCMANRTRLVCVDVAWKGVQLGVGEGLTGLTEPRWPGPEWRAIVRPCSAGGYEAQITSSDRVDRGWLAQQRLLSPTQAMLDRLVHQAPDLRVVQSGHGTSGRW